MDSTCTRCNRGLRAIKNTARASGYFKCTYWTNSCLLINTFQKREHIPAPLFYHFTATHACPVTPRSTLQGQMAFSEQPDPALALHPIVQSSLFPSSDVFQPAETLYSPVCSSTATPQFVVLSILQPLPEHNPACLLLRACFYPISSLHKQQFNPSFRKENPFTFYCAAQTWFSILTSMGIPPWVPWQPGLAVVLRLLKFPVF